MEEKGGLPGLAAFRRDGKRQEPGEPGEPGQDKAERLTGDCTTTGVMAVRPGVLERGSAPARRVGTVLIYPHHTVSRRIPSARLLSRFLSRLPIRFTGNDVKTST
jgi:hypothetical protein